MKKLIVYTFLFFYSASFIKPFVPAIVRYVSITVWKISHTNHIKNIDGRINLLVELADIAKHNNPKQENNPQPDSFKSSSEPFFCIVPKFNYNFLCSEYFEKYFQHDLSNLPSAFHRNATPPPKVA